LPDIKPKNKKNNNYLLEFNNQKEAKDAKDLLNKVFKDEKALQIRSVLFDVIKIIFF
jgi:hypothetical protein